MKNEQTSKDDDELPILNFTRQMLAAWLDCEVRTANKRYRELLVQQGLGYKDSLTTYHMAIIKKVPERRVVAFVNNFGKPKRLE
jgi:DNA polymerase III delta prime subunit